MFGTHKSHYVNFRRFSAERLGTRGKEGWEGLEKGQSTNPPYGLENLTVGAGHSDNNAYPLVGVFVR